MAKAIDLTLEREVQRRVIELYEGVGCVVKRTSGGRSNGTRNAPGLPDLIVFPPERRVQNGMVGMFFHETKRPGGKQSPAQIEWQQLCDSRLIEYVVGGTEAAIRFLKSIGLLAA